MAQTNGLQPYIDENGMYYFAKSRDSKNKYSLGNVYTYDSAGNYTYGVMSVREVKQGELYTIELSVDEEFLTDKNTVYPVYVDPTLTIKGEGLTEAYIYNGDNYKNKNYLSFSDENQTNYIGFSTKYGVGRYIVNAGDVLSNNPVLYMYADEIISATFNVYFSHVRLNTEKISLHMYEQTWTKKNITWENGASYYVAKPEDTKEIQSSCYATFDIESLLEYWLYHEKTMNMGMLLKREDESNKTCEYFCDATSSSKRPYIAIQYKTDLSEIYKTDVEIYVGESLNLAKSDIYETAELLCTSEDTDVVIINNKGVITGKMVGITTVQITVDPNGYPQTLTCTVCVKKCPSKFEKLINSGVMKYTEIETIENDEKFYIFKYPISTIIKRYGVTPLNEVLTHYIFCIMDNGIETYGLVGFKTNNASNSCVSISFRNFDMSKLIGCKTSELMENLNVEIKKKMANMPINDYDINLLNYFRAWDSLGGYLIADLYISRVITDTFVNSKLTVNTKANNYVKNYTCGDYKNSNLASAVDKYNELAGKIIYDLDTGIISLNNRYSPTIYEKLMILVSHTGNTSYQSFVAEIKSHADWVLGTDEEELAKKLQNGNVGGLVDALVNITLDDYVNKHTIVADMSIGSYDYNDKSKSNTIVQFLISTKMYGIKKNSPVKYKYMLS